MGILSIVWYIFVGIVFLVAFVGILSFVIYGSEIVWNAFKCKRIKKFIEKAAPILFIPMVVLSFLLLTYTIGRSIISVLV